MAWSARGSHRAERAAARHRWDELLPARGGMLEGGAPVRSRAHGSPREADAGPLPNAGTYADGAPPGAPHRGGPAPAESGQSQHTRRRLVLSLRAAVALVVVLAVCSGLWWWSSASAAPDVRSVETVDEAEDGHGDESAAGQPEDGGAPAPGGAGMADGHDVGDGIVAHVAGAVAAPGVYRLPRGARYHEAIAAAGGAGPDADVHRLNLAAAVEDGVRLYVPRIGEAGDPASGGAPVAGGSAAPPGSPTAGGPAGSPGGRVNLNTATVEELGALPRVGPVLAQRIVDFRTQHGRFGAPEDLDAVDGIGPKMLEALLPLVTV